MPDRQETESQRGSLLERGSGLLGRLTDTVKEVSRASLLKQALEARERGNLPAAFWLLEEAHARDPEVLDVCVAFWDTAVEYGRPRAAAKAVAFLTERHAGDNALELACQYWCEFVALDPAARASPTALGRILHLLQHKADEADDEKEKAQRSAALVRALQAIMDERDAGLTPTLAFRVADLARELDPACALDAARFCLGYDGLHDAKRQRIVEIVRALDPEADLELPEPEPSTLTPPSPSAHRGAARKTQSGRGNHAKKKPIAERCPARRHPLRTESPAYAPMTPAEIARTELPPLHAAPEPHDADAEDAGPCDPPEQTLDAELVCELEPDDGQPVDGVLEADLVEG